MTDDAPRLYLATPPALALDALVAMAEAALRTHHVACLRLDRGGAAEAEWIAAANRLLPPCHAAEVPLVIAEHHRLVRPLGLDGVHLAQNRTPIRSLRRELGGDCIIGAHGGTTRHQGMVLAEAGADYVAFGPVADPGPLGDGRVAEPALFQWWAEMIETPVVAEGGIGEAETRTLAGTADFIVPDAAAWTDPAGLATALDRFAAALDPAKAG